MKIYTKAGDRGETGLFGGQRLSKSSLRICAIGDVDELNAAIGLTRALVSGTRNPGAEGAGEEQGTSRALASETEILDEELAAIQGWLFELGAELGTPPNHRNSNATLSDRQIEVLEESIDRQTAALPPLKSFILPGGSLLAAHLHMARCVCRRAERQVLALASEEPVREVAIAFMNRLSDWFFTAARTANRLASVEDIKWSK